MRIDVVHQRDPDASCDIAVYVDGQKVEFHDWDFDPGTGYTEADFEETKKSTLDDAPISSNRFWRRPSTRWRRRMNGGGCDDRRYPVGRRPARGDLGRPC